MSDYLPILIFVGIAIAFGGGTIVFGYLVRPGKPYREKLYPYESGMPPLMEAHVMFPMRYYLIAMLFVIFDIEAVFIYPWAVSFMGLGAFALVEMLVFIAILLVGYFYAWQKGALEWD